jgi:stage V sporulation protein G
MSMKIMEITIRPATEHLVKGYADIVFDNCFMFEGIRIIQRPTGLFISFPAKKRIDGTHWDIAFPANAETRQIIQQAILAKYEKIVAGNSPLANAK